MERQPQPASGDASLEPTGVRPSTPDLGLVLVAALAIASAAVLARYADAPALALAFWRCLGGAVVLAPAAVRSPVRPAGSQWALLAASGMALGLHFATWLASLEHTSIAASVTLVSTTPVFVALWLWSRGAPVGRQTWGALAITFVGIVLITGGGAVAGADQLGGNGLALVGAAAMAAYLVLGGHLRSRLGTAAYSAPTYALAAIGVLPVALLTGTDLVGFDGRTWLAIAVMTLGPQLAGHTLLNALLPRLGSITVALALLTEPVGAAVLAWMVFSEVPGLPVWLGAPLVIGGLVVHTFGGQRFSDGASWSRAADSSS